MRFYVPNSVQYQGKITAPPSKSYLQRAIALACLCNEESVINGYVPSQDVDAAISIVRGLGASINIIDKTIKIKGDFPYKQRLTIRCGESGLLARMFAPIVALHQEIATIEGSGTLLLRPMQMIVDALKQGNKNITSNDGFLPIEMYGQLQNGTYIIDGSESSQLLSGMLIALPLLDGDSMLNVSNLVSIPYIELTIQILYKVGINIKHNNYNTFYIKGNQKPNATIFDAEGDWSGAAFHLVGGAIGGNVEVLGLNLNSVQADKKIIEILQKSGAKVELKDNIVSVKKHKLQSFECDLTHCPDLFPPVATLAAYCQGETILYGANRLINKESNRAMALQNEFQKLGINIRLEDNAMIIKGSEPIGGIVSSHNDHRIAMALSILGLKAKGSVIIENAEAVTKSYPEFFNDFQKLAN